MKAQELRIGNWINDLTGYECQVRGTTSNGIWIHDVGGPGTEAAFTPIELTTEWLERFGFIKDLNGDYWYHEKMRTFSRDRMYIYLPYGLWDSMAPCKYVHQLQNLYFALTGKELELK